MQDTPNRIRVWDPFVRIGHWTLAAAFFIAYFTAEDLEDVHIWAGYWVGAYVLARTVWGFIGTRYARFSDFVRGPKAIFEYLAGLIKGRPAHYFGHNPAGGAMIVALLLCLAATVYTGLAVEADSENEGPLAPWLGHAGQRVDATALPAPSARAEAASSAHPAVTEDEEDEAHEESGKGESAYEELHEWFANLSLGLVVLHLLGVISGSWLHRENLVRAMITGYKIQPPAPPEPARRSPADKV